MQKEKCGELDDLQLLLQLRFLGLYVVDLVDFSIIILIIIPIFGRRVVVLGITFFLLGIISFLLGIIVFLLDTFFILLGIILFLLGTFLFLLGIIVFLLGTFFFLLDIIVFFLGTFFLLGSIVLLISDNNQGFELGLDRKHVSRWGFFVGYNDIWKGRQR
ncbi:hypothetical protein BGZ88_002401, partial [Linnemannia elongata]